VHSGGLSDKVTTILANGNFDPLFARAVAGSFHFVIPRKMPASACGVNFNSELMPETLYVGATTPSALTLSSRTFCLLIVTVPLHPFEG